MTILKCLYIAKDENVQVNMVVILSLIRGIAADVSEFLGLYVLLMCCLQFAYALRKHRTEFLKVQFLVPVCVS